MTRVVELFSKSIHVFQNMNSRNLL